MNKIYKEEIISLIKKVNRYFLRVIQKEKKLRAIGNEHTVHEQKKNEKKYLI